jgi:hypothetical protein
MSNFDCQRRLTELQIRPSHFGIPPAGHRVEQARRACARAAFDENLTHYKQQIPAFFWFNAPLE